MRTSYCILVLALILNACSKNDVQEDVEDFKANTFPQEWKLVKMTGSVQGSESIGEEMPYQEHYIFNADGSFTKTREKEGTTTSAEGTYTYQEEEEKAFILTYKNSNGLIGSCTSGNSEYLYFNEGSPYLYSSWWACDGPGLFYERVKVDQYLKK